MSDHFHNVNTLLECVQNHDLDKLTELIYDNLGEPECSSMPGILEPRVLHWIVEPDDDNIRYLAEDIAYVMISLWGGMTREAKKDLPERVTKESVDREIELMFGDYD